MKNLIKLISLTTFTILLTFGSAFAQDDTKSSKSENKCSGTCCSSKEADTKMKMEDMDHKEMSDQISIDKNKDGKIFECPMKCEAGKDAPGECSKCGMNLKEVSVKEVGHKMMDHSKMKHSKMEHKANQNTKKVEFKELDKNNDGKVFQCAMKCELPQDKSGKCSKCSMNLKEVSIESLK